MDFPQEEEFISIMNRLFGSKREEFPPLPMLYECKVQSILREMGNQCYQLAANDKTLIVSDPLKFVNAIKDLDLETVRPLYVYLAESNDAEFDPLMDYISQEVPYDHLKAFFEILQKIE